MNDEIFIPNPVTTKIYNVLNHETGMELDGTLITFLADDKLELEGFLNKGKSKTALLFIHGMGGFFWSRTGTVIFELCKQHDLGCLLANTRGRGLINRFKYRTEEESEPLIGGTSFEKFEDCLHDINGAISYLKEQGYEQIILCGHSTGCQKLLYFQEQESAPQEVAGLILMAPADDYHVFRQEIGNDFERAMHYAKEHYDQEIINNEEPIGFFSPRRFYDLLRDDSVEGNLLNYETDLSHIKTIQKPMLTIFGKEEENAVMEPAEMLKKIEANHSNEQSKTVLTAGNHTFKGGEEELKETISGFLSSIGVIDTSSKENAKDDSSTAASSS